jgi:hypothetical protein
MVTDSLELVHFFKNIYVAHVPHTNNVATQIPVANTILIAYLVQIHLSCLSS